MVLRSPPLSSALAWLFLPLPSGLEVKMRVIQKFSIASLFLWAVHIAILYAFNNNLLPGTSNVSPHSSTLLSGFLVIALYIYLAMREPADKQEPDPKFLAEAKGSINQSTGDAQTIFPAS
ncbi:uncharacterized protein [Cicer arietinum]|uniref:Uncharacterized protein LOC105853035 n=1 Tax=Cicer arietinum TaxID=3827 RepID=A0A1S3EJD4_CICAR|nr:uncharacterized protein LOC105853035 [Cicer arietinum]